MSLLNSFHLGKKSNDSLENDFHVEINTLTQLNSCWNENDMDYLACAPAIDTPNDQQYENDNLDDYFQNDQLPNVAQQENISIQENTTRTEKLLEEYSQGLIPKATMKKRLWAMHTFNKWKNLRNNTNDNICFPPNSLETYNVEDINKYISLFILELYVDKWRPKTLMELILQLQQNINNNLKNDSYKFLAEPRFKQIKNTLDRKMREMSAIGNNLSSTKANVVTYEKENMLWSAGIFGLETPQKLLATVIYSMGLNFALRSSEHVALTTNNFEIGQINGKKVLTYREFISKNHNGGLKDVGKKVKEVVAFSNDKDDCRDPVKIYQMYLSHRPQNCTERLYLKPLKNICSQVWYTRQPLGVTSIGNIIKQCLKYSEQEGDLSQKFTPHSLRATAATRLYERGVEEQQICEITGHCSTSVRDYKRTNAAQKQLSSYIVQGISTSSSCSYLPKKSDNPQLPKLTFKRKCENWEIVGNKTSSANLTEYGNGKMSVRIDCKSSTIDITYD